MMIKINLLPVRQVKKREASKQILVLYAVLLVGALVGNYLWYDWRESVAAEGRAKIQRTEQKIAELQKVIGQVDTLNVRKKELEDKLAVLTTLRRGRTGPVRLLDALAEATPKKVWIRDFDEKAEAVKISGWALSHEDLAEFMRGLGTMVWTSKGMGRLIEEKRDSKTRRVELIDQNGAIEDFSPEQVGNFFTAIELKKANQTSVKTDLGEVKRVEFDLTLRAHYTL
ncbi:MAG: PilN domain-containing protein [Myxococcaceae bacterium]|nr:PilN domain-containing protein [Myxococcaceae bacterium]